MKRNSPLLLLTILTLGCAQPPAPPPPAPPQPSGPRVVFPDGFAVRVEVVADDESRARGLMFRDRLPENEGMLFIFPAMDEHPFWMKNTLIALDMIWIDGQRRVVHVKSHVPPCQADPCPSYPPGVPSQYVLEVAGGVAAKHGVTAGAQLRFEELGNFLSP